MSKLVIFSVQRSSHKSGEVSPSLFGLEFAPKSKELRDQVKAMRSTLSTPKPFSSPNPQPPSQPSPQIGLEEGEEPRKDAQTRESHSRRMHGKSDLCTYAISKTVIINWKCTLLNQIACISRYAAGTQVGTPSGKLFGAYGY